MSLRAALRGAFAGRSTAGPDCFGCVYFCDDPQRIEAELPGLAVLSSGHASVRARDGLCLAHRRIVNGRRRCIDFAAR